MTRLLLTFAALALTSSTVSAQAFTSEKRDETRNAASAVVTMAIPLTTDEHMALARRALDAGDYTTARRAYKVAALLEREDGRVPAAAVFGLVNVLNVQGALGEAVEELERLASDAARAANDEIEARALADAIWIKMETRGRMAARNDAVRLRELLKGNTLSQDTRQYVTQRVQ
jgi:hypothetical protein